MKYVYETHLHTAEASACGGTYAKDYIHAYMDKGYAGIFVTDHFFNGNCAVPDDLPWAEKVELYCAGYENALRAAEGTGFQVFFGIEYNFNCDEYLLYGLDKQWLKNHPEIMELSHRDLFELVDSTGGLVVQAHPFRQRSYIKSINLHPEAVHAVEAYNAANKGDENQKAAEYAAMNNLPVTSGSDMHNKDSLKNENFKAGGIAFATPLNSAKDFVERIKTGSNYTALYV